MRLNLALLLLVWLISHCGCVVRGNCTSDNTVNLWGEDVLDVYAESCFPICKEDICPVANKTRDCLCFKENYDLTKGDGIFYAMLSLSYLLSTIVFPVLIFFNVNFASGSGYIFVFFYQCLPLVTPLGKLQVYFVLQNQFYDNPFVNHPLASRFYVLEYFKYILLAFELFLVVFLVKCSWCPMKNCRLPWAKARRAVRNFREKHVPKRTILHGICSGIVLAYGDLLAISSLILVNYLTTCCYNVDGESCPQFCASFKYIQNYYGQSETVNHVGFYALPGVIFLLLLPLPLSLIYYPSIPALFHKLTKTSLPRFPKLDPVFDVFQGVYKDNMRWFAGVHLLGLMVLWFVHAALYFDPNLQNFVNLTLLVLMLGVHSLCQPHKVDRRNYFQTLCIIYLVLIASVNQLALFIKRIYSEGAADTTSRDYLDQVVDVIPHVFIYLTFLMGLVPLGFLLTVWTYRNCYKNGAVTMCCGRLHCCCGGRSSEERNSEEVVQVPYQTEW